MKRTLFAALSAAALFFVASSPSKAAQSYETFTAGAQAKHGLFTIWQKDGGTYLEIAPQQLDTDFLETIAPGNGIGQDPVWWGDTDYLPTQILRFQRRGENVVMIWRNWYAHAGSNAQEYCGY